MTFPDDIIRVVLKEMDFEGEPMKFDDEIFQELYLNSQKEILAYLMILFSPLLNISIFRFSEGFTRAKISRVLKTVNPDFEFLPIAPEL